MITSGGKGGQEEVHHTTDFQKDKLNKSVGVELLT